MTGHAWVYIMVRADGLRKLGCSTDPRGRRIQLRVQTGVKHVLETSWKMPEAEARMTERLSHLKLRPHRAQDCNSIECYPLSRPRITEVVLWAAGLAKELCEAEAPGALTDDDVLAIASGEPMGALLQQAARGVGVWRSMVRRAEIAADEAIPEATAQKMIDDFHAFCYPPPGRMVRRDGRFFFLTPDADVTEREIGRLQLERIINGALSRAKV